jgi:hypothetical protein
MNYSYDYGPIVTQFLGENYSDRRTNSGRSIIGGQNYHRGVEGNAGTAIGVSYAENGREWWSSNADIAGHPGFLEELTKLNISPLVLGSFSLWGTEKDKRKKIPSFNIRGPFSKLKDDNPLLNRLVPLVADSLVLSLCLRSLDKKITVTNRGVLISDDKNNQYLILSPTMIPMNYIPVRRIFGTIYKLPSIKGQLFWNFERELGAKVKALIAEDSLYVKFLKIAEDRGYI